jgi:hypothetical protein
VVAGRNRVNPISEMVAGSFISTETAPPSKGWITGALPPKVIAISGRVWLPIVPPRNRLVRVVVGHRVGRVVEIPGKIRIEGIGGLRNLGNRHDLPLAVNQEETLPRGLPGLAGVPVRNEAALVEVAGEIHVQIRVHDLFPLGIALDLLRRLGSAASP